MSLLDRNSELEMRGHETHFPDVLDIFCLSFQTPSFPFVIFLVTRATVVTVGHHWASVLWLSLDSIGWKNQEEMRKWRVKRRVKLGTHPGLFPTCCHTSLCPSPGGDISCQMTSHSATRSSWWGHSLHLPLLVTSPKYFAILTTTLEVVRIFNFHQLSCSIMIFF